jgi:hypothetical protein
MNKVYLYTAVAVVLSSAAFADEVPSASGVMSLSANLGNIGPAGDEVDTSGFDVNADIQFQVTENFSVGFDFAHGEDNLVVDEGVTFETTGWGIEPKYVYDNNAFAGLYYQDVSLGVEGDTLDLNSVGVFGGYDAKNYSVELYAGQTTADVLHIDATNLGVSGSFMASDDIELYGHYSVGNWVEWYPGITTLVGAGFDYKASTSISVYGAVTLFDIMESSDSITQVALGMGADLGAMGVGLPGMLTADWTHTDYGFDGVTGDTFAIGWTISFGGSDARSQNCVINSARGKNRSPFSALYECIGLF